MGQVTIAIKRRKIAGNSRRTYFDLTLSNSYATGGDTIAAADLQSLLPEYRAPTTFNVVDLFIPEPAKGDGLEVALDRANAKFQAWNGRTQVANATDLSAITVRCMLEYGDEPSPNV